MLFLQGNGLSADRATQCRSWWCIVLFTDSWASHSTISWTCAQVWQRHSVHGPGPTHLFTVYPLTIDHVALGDILYSLVDKANMLSLRNARQEDPPSFSFSSSPGVAECRVQVWEDLCSRPWNVQWAIKEMLAQSGCIVDLCIWLATYTNICSDESVPCIYQNQKHNGEHPLVDAPVLWTSIAEALDFRTLAIQGIKGMWH